MNSLNKKILLAVGCFAIGGLMLSLTNAQPQLIINTNNPAKHTGKLKELHLNSESIKSDSNYLRLSKGLKGSGNAIITSTSSMIGGGQGHNGSNVIIGGGSGNAGGSSSIIIGGEKNKTSGNSGIIAGGSNHEGSTSNYGVVLGGSGNTSAGKSLSLGRNSKAGTQAFSRNTGALSQSSSISASSGLLIGTTTSQNKNANIVVNGLIRYANETLGNNDKGAIQVSNGCFYAYDGKWHLIGGKSGAECNEATAKNCQWGAIELKDGDEVIGYKSSKNCGTQKVKCSNSIITPSGASPYCYDY